ncbi:hypothetical protein HOY82DRAFT_672174 [Tuber indicum]|nr:hypothetical protein HOY82DRAFT_672174 [Tuber indicum]
MPFRPGYPPPTLPSVWPTPKDGRTGRLGPLPECGGFEPADQSHLDASLLQAGSCGQVRVVIQVRFHKREDRTGAQTWINRATPTQNASFKTPLKLMQAVLPPPTNPVETPSITFEESFAGDCPPGMAPKGYVFLDLENLRILARKEIIARDSVPMNKFSASPVTVSIARAAVCGAVCNLPPLPSWIGSEGGYGSSMERACWRAVYGGEVFAKHCGS